MSVTIEDLLARAQRAEQQNRNEIARWLGLLDLQPKLPPESIRRAIDEELMDQCTRAVQALDLLAAEGHDSEVLQQARASFVEATSLDRAALVAWLSHDLSDRLRHELQVVLDRYDAFVRRLGWLLCPSTFEKVQELDPKRDANQIYHYISYEFRVEQKLFAVLFETRPALIPYTALMFHSTGEFTVRAFKRINDTVMFFSNLLEWGLDSKRGRDAIARVNSIHGRYSVSSDAFRFILSGIMFVPVIWNERMGFRKFTEVERLGWFHAFAEIGRAMNIHGITDDYDEMYAWWKKESETAGESSAVGFKLFAEVAIQVLQTYPEDLRESLLVAVVGGMDDVYREALDLPPVPAEEAEKVRRALAVIGEASRKMPRVPWIRSLQLYPLYWDVNTIGVGKRSTFLPRMPNGDEARSNGGHPEHQLPITTSASVPTTELPVIAREEVAKHGTLDDAWIIVDGLVYDLSRMIYEHPGGADALVPWLGKDATKAFERVGHSNQAVIMMANFVIGRLPDRADDVPLRVSVSTRNHRGRRRGKGKEYRADAWRETATLLLSAVRQYDEAVRSRPKPMDQFAIPLPFDPRVAARARAE